MTFKTSSLSWIGLFVTLVIMLILGVTAIREPSRQEQARSEQRSRAIRMGTDLYALHCAECHGSAGQGDIQKDAKALNNEYESSRSTDYLYDVIANGRDNTDMAAFALDKGGAFTRQQVESLVILIRHGTWDEIAQRVQELGMVSEEEQILAAGGIVPTESQNDLPVILVLPTSVPTTAGPTQDELGQGLYLSNCGSCHGGSGEGTSDGPPLVTDSVRQMARSALSRISFDNDDIEGHDVFLSSGDKSLIINWVEQLAGIQR